MRTLADIETDAHGGIQALIAVLQRTLKAELSAVRDEQAKYSGAVKQRYSRRRVQLEAALAFVEQVEPHSLKLAAALSHITHSHLKRSP